MSVITIKEFLDQLTTPGNYKEYFDKTCQEKKKDIQETFEKIKTLLNQKENTLDLETILKLKDFLKDFLQKDPARSLLRQRLEISKDISYNINELFFVNSVYRFLHALNREHPLLKEPLNFINLKIHLNEEFNNKVEIKKDVKHEYSFKPGFDPYRDEKLSTIIHNILYYDSDEDDMKQAKHYMQRHIEFFKDAAQGPHKRRGGKKSKKSRKFRKYKKSKKHRKKKSRNKRR